MHAQDGALLGESSLNSLAEVWAQNGRGYCNLDIDIPAMSDSGLSPTIQTLVRGRAPSSTSWFVEADWVSKFSRSAWA